MESHFSKYLSDVQITLQPQEKSSIPVATNGYKCAFITQRWHSGETCKSRIINGNVASPEFLQGFRKMSRLEN